MDIARLDALARAMSASRRGTLRTLVSSALGVLLSGWGVKEAAAGCKKVGNKCDKSKDCCDGAKCKGGKNGKCRCKSGLSDCPGEKACLDLNTDLNNCGACGNPCAAGELCCDGVCADLQSDDNNCAACGQSCGEGNSCIAGVCTTADGCPVGADACAGDRVACGNITRCVCSRSTEGGTFCGDLLTPGPICGQCDSNADCASFGPGALCVETGSVNCCGSSQQNVCRLPCPAS
jgi:hypothetical protein